MRVPIIHSFIGLLLLSQLTISQIRKIQAQTSPSGLNTCTVTKKRIKNQEKTEKRHNNAVVIGRNFLNFR